MAGSRAGLPQVHMMMPHDDPEVALPVPGCCTAEYPDYRRNIKHMMTCHQALEKPLQYKCGHVGTPVLAGPQQGM